MILPVTVVVSCESKSLLLIDWWLIVGHIKSLSLWATTQKDCLHDDLSLTCSFSCAPFAAVTGTSTVLLVIFFYSFLPPFLQCRINRVSWQHGNGEAMNLFSGLYRSCSQLINCLSYSDVRCFFSDLNKQFLYISLAEESSLSLQSAMKNKFVGGWTERHLCPFIATLMWQGQGRQGIRE